MTPTRGLRWIELLRILLQVSRFQTVDKEDDLDCQVKEHSLSDSELFVHKGENPCLWGELTNT